MTDSPPPTPGNPAPRAMPEWLPFVLAILAYAVVRLGADIALRSWLPDDGEPGAARIRWMVAMVVAVLVAAGVLFLAARWMRARER